MEFIIHWLVLKYYAQTSHKISRIQKITSSTNRYWYFSKNNTFSSFEEEIINSIQLNGKIINMMLSTKFLQTLTPRYLTLFWLSQYNKFFFFNYVFKSPFFFSYLDIIKICFNKFLFFKLSETFCICLFSVMIDGMIDGMSWYLLWLMENDTYLDIFAYLVDWVSFVVLMVALC